MENFIQNKTSYYSTWPEVVIQKLNQVQRFYSASGGCLVDPPLADAPKSSTTPAIKHAKRKSASIPNAEHFGNINFAINRNFSMFDSGI